MSSNNPVQSLLWKLRFINKKLKLNWSYFKFSVLKKFLPKREKPADFSKVKKILIVRNDRHGDMIATTGLIRELAKAGFEVYVSSEKSSLDIIEHNPYVKGAYPYKEKSLKDLFQSIRAIREHEFDAVIDLKYCRGVYKKNIFFCSFVKSPILIGFNKSNIPAYNVSIPYYEQTAHVTTRLPYILALFGIQDFDLGYEIFTDEAMKTKADDFIKSHFDPTKKIVVVNPLGGNKSRWLSQAELDASLAALMPHYQPVMIGEASQLKNLSWPTHIPLFQSKNILEIVPLIEKADLVFSVDTSVVHIASAFSKSTIALYLDTVDAKATSELRSEYNAKVTKYGTHLLNLLSDAPYIKQHACDERPPINHLNWSPNNPNADQIIFNYRSFADIPLPEFTSTIETAIKKIAS